jgi:beta-N-acetylhexosaminidase
MAPDLEPYRQLKLDAVMPAHVIYPKIDARPAGFSPVWIAKLRKEFGFDGVIFSDDLSMEGASVAGGIVERVEAAASAGVDMLLVCNAPDKVGEVLERWQPVADPARAARIARLLPEKPAMAWSDLRDDITCRAGHQVIARLAGIWPGPGLG